MFNLNSYVAGFVFHLMFEGFWVDGLIMNLRKFVFTWLFLSYFTPLDHHILSLFCRVSPAVDKFPRIRP